MQKNQFNVAETIKSAETRRRISDLALELRWKMQQMKAIEKDQTSITHPVTTFAFD
jgi:hypothetical protein